MDERGRILSITFSLFLYSDFFLFPLSLSLCRFVSLTFSLPVYISHTISISSQLISLFLPLSCSLFLSFSPYLSIYLSTYLSLLHCLTFSLFLLSLFDTPGTFDGVPGYVITRIDEVRKQTKLNLLHITHLQSYWS